MKLLISNQYGAVVMALLPFLYGMFSRPLIWQDLFLLSAWCALYLFAYPFFSLLKGHNPAPYKKWCRRYTLASAVCAIPALWYNWRIIYAIFAMLPFAAVSVYFVRQKDERNLFNDLAGIAIFAVAGVMAYGFNHPLDQHTFEIIFYPALFFIGTTLYVKSSMRERKNPKYYRASVYFHIACLVFFALIRQRFLFIAFVPPLIRACLLPKQKLSVKRIGLFETALSLFFFIVLLIDL